MTDQSRKTAHGRAKAGRITMGENASEAVSTVRAQDPRSAQKGVKLYFDNLAAGESTRVVKNNELVMAAAYGDIARVRELVISGADVHTGDDRPFQLAAANGHVETVQYLLDNEADVRAHDNEALVKAAENGYDDVVKLLLDRGADTRYEEARNLASKSRAQTPGSFNARRPTPDNGHANTVKILDVHLGVPASS